MKKWKLYIYAQRHFIKKITIDEEENPFENKYIINVFFKKYILGSNYAKIMVEPRKLKLTDEKKRQIHVEADLYDGVDLRKEG